MRVLFQFSTSTFCIRIKETLEDALVNNAKIFVCKDKLLQDTIVYSPVVKENIENNTMIMDKTMKISIFEMNGRRSGNHDDDLQKFIC
jgi:hypothetical protein